MNQILFVVFLNLVLIPLFFNRKLFNADRENIFTQEAVGDKKNCDHAIPVPATGKLAIFLIF